MDCSVPVWKILVAILSVNLLGLAIWCGTLFVVEWLQGRGGRHRH